MKSYKESLAEFEKSGLYLYKVVTATEVQYSLQYYDMQITDEEFEIVCRFIYDLYSDYEGGSVEEISNKFFENLEQGLFTIKDITDDFDKVNEIMWHDL